MVGADDAGARRAVLDHEALPEALAQVLRQDARDEVGAAAGREGHDDAHRAHRVFLRAEGSRYGEKDDCKQRAAHG